MSGKGRLACALAHTTRGIAAPRSRSGNDITLRDSRAPRIDRARADARKEAAPRQAIELDLGLDAIGCEILADEVGCDQPAFGINPDGDRDEQQGDDARNAGERQHPSPATLAAVAAILAAVALMASLVPAYRALRLDPVKALRAP